MLRSGSSMVSYIIMTLAMDMILFPIHPLPLLLVHYIIDLFLCLLASNMRSRLVYCVDLVSNS